MDMEMHVNVFIKFMFTLQYSLLNDAGGAFKDKPQTHVGNL